MESEFLPVVSGVLAGLVLGGVTARRRPWIWTVLSVLFGIAATIVSGEFRATWAYLLVDIPLVGATSAATFLASRKVRRRRLSLAGPGTSTVRFERLLALQRGILCQGGWPRAERLDPSFVILTANSGVEQGFCAASG